MRHRAVRPEENVVGGSGGEDDGGERGGGKALTGGGGHPIGVVARIGRGGRRVCGQRDYAKGFSK